MLLAYAHALMAGESEARDHVAETFELMEQRFWEPQHGLYADEATAGWELSPYRGQNANMHGCEAMLAAFDATGELRYLHRAETLARNIPKAMFVFLPLLALCMKLIYWRPRRYYVEHLLFMVHNHTFVFLVTGAIMLGVQSLKPEPKPLPTPERAPAQTTA